MMKKDEYRWHSTDPWQVVTLSKQGISSTELREELFK